MSDVQTMVEAIENTGGRVLDMGGYPRVVGRHAVVKALAGDVWTHRVEVLRFLRARAEAAAVSRMVTEVLGGSVEEFIYISTNRTNRTIEGTGGRQQN